MKNTLKSIGIIFLAFIMVFILSIVADTCVEKSGLFMPLGTELFPWRIILSVIYRSIFTLFAGYAVARSAPSRPMMHVFILGTLLTLVYLFGAFIVWDMNDNWYPLIFIVTALPLTVLGGKLRR